MNGVGIFAGIIALVLFVLGGELENHNRRVNLCREAAQSNEAIERCPQPKNLEGKAILSFAVDTLKSVGNYSNATYLQIHR